MHPYNQLLLVFSLFLKGLDLFPSYIWREFSNLIKSPFAFCFNRQVPPFHTCLLFLETKSVSSNAEAFGNFFYHEGFQRAVFSCGWVKAEYLGNADTICLLRVWNVERKIKLILKKNIKLLWKILAFVSSKFWKIFWKSKKLSKLIGSIRIYLLLVSHNILNSVVLVTNKVTFKVKETWK